MNTEAKRLKRALNVKIARSISTILVVALAFVIAGLGFAFAVPAYAVLVGVALFALNAAVFAGFDLIAGIKVKLANRRAFKIAEKQAETVKLGQEIMTERAKLEKAEAKLGKKTSKVQIKQNKLTAKEQELRAKAEAERAEAERVAQEAINVAKEVEAKKVTLVKK